MSTDTNGFNKLLALYCATHFETRLPSGKRVVLRIGAGCPSALLALLKVDADIAFISACNPRSQPTPTQVNRHQQHELLNEFTRNGHRCLPGVGRIPGHAWREPSLLVIGAPLTLLDRLARRFDQNAIVHGSVIGAMRLRVYRDDWRDATRDLASAIEFA